MSDTQTVLAWGFVGPDMQDDSPTELTFNASRDNRLYISRSAFDALCGAVGPIVCRVRMRDDITEDGHGRLFARNCEVVAAANATRELHAFACWCVRETQIGDGRTVWDLLNDDRSRWAVEASEAYVKDTVTGDELARARAEASIVAVSATALRVVSVSASHAEPQNNALKRIALKVYAEELAATAALTTANTVNPVWSLPKTVAEQTLQAAQFAWASSMEVVTHQEFTARNNAGKRIQEMEFERRMLALIEEGWNGRSTQ